MPDLLTAFIVVLIGLCFGSFITLLAYRLPREMPVGAVRSRCPSCKTPLGARDLFPVASWALARGRCRHCQAPVHWRYPAIELLTALSFLLVIALVGLNLPGIILCLLAVCIITLCVIDFEFRIIPDSLQWAMALQALWFRWVTDASYWEAFYGLLLGAFIGLALKYGFLWLRKKDGLGMGDVKLLAVAGLWLGVDPFSPFIFYSGVLGVITGMAWRCFHPDPRFPFGPALALSMFALVVYPPLDAMFWQVMRNIIAYVSQLAH